MSPWLTQLASVTDRHLPIPGNAPPPLVNRTADEAGGAGWRVSTRGVKDVGAQIAGLGEDACSCLTESWDVHL